MLLIDVGSFLNDVLLSRPIKEQYVGNDIPLLILTELGAAQDWAPQPNRHQTQDLLTRKVSNEGSEENLLTLSSLNHIFFAIVRPQPLYIYKRFQAILHH